MTTMLDANTQALIWQSILSFTVQQQVGLVVISHDKPLLQRLGGRILILTDDPVLPIQLALMATAKRDYRE